jgi:hypothetical protein
MEGSRSWEVVVCRGGDFLPFYWVLKFESDSVRLADEQNEDHVSDLSRELEQ